MRVTCVYPCLYHVCTMRVPCVYHACTNVCTMRVLCVYHCVYHPCTMRVPCVDHASDVMGPHSNQFEILGCAVIVGLVIRGFYRHDTHRVVLEVDHFSHGRL